MPLLFFALTDVCLFSDISGMQVCNQICRKVEKQNLPLSWFDCESGRFFVLYTYFLSLNQLLLVCKPLSDKLISTNRAQLLGGFCNSSCLILPAASGSLAIIYK